MSPLEDLLSRTYSTVSIAEPETLEAASEPKVASEAIGSIQDVTYRFSASKESPEESASLVQHDLNGLTAAVELTGEAVHDPEVSGQSDIDSAMPDEADSPAAIRTSDLTTMVPFSAAATVPVDVIEIAIRPDSPIAEEEALTGAELDNSAVEPEAKLLERSEPEQKSPEEGCGEQLLAEETPVDEQKEPDTQFTLELCTVREAVDAIEAKESVGTAAKPEPVDAPVVGTQPVSEENGDSGAALKSVVDESTQVVVADETSVRTPPPAETEEVPEESARVDVSPVVDESDKDNNQAVLRPEWEVDNFLWPTICTKIESRVQSELAILIDSLQDEGASRGSKVVIVAGEPQRGTTTMTLCLARAAARKGKSVAILDLNHRGPAIADRLGVACEAGVESLPRADVDPNSICIVAILEGVTLLPLLTPVDVNYCGSPAVGNLIELVEANHDIVLIDASVEVADVLQSQGQSFCTIGVADVSRFGSGQEVCLGTGASETLGIIRNFAA